MSYTDEQITQWSLNAMGRGGGFVSSVATAVRYADLDNYALIRPFVVQMITKYPEYLKGGF